MVAAIAQSRRDGHRDCGTRYGEMSWLARFGDRFRRARVWVVASRLRLRTPRDAVHVTLETRLVEWCLYAFKNATGWRNLVPKAPAVTVPVWPEGVASYGEAESRDPRDGTRPAEKVYDRCSCLRGSSPRADLGEYYRVPPRPAPDRELGEIVVEARAKSVLTMSGSDYTRKHDAS